MKDARARLLHAVALCGLAILPAASHAQDAAKATKLPEAVKKTFQDRFPKGEIAKVDVEEEGGVKVYDIEFKDGAVEKETDIAEDGTMLEFTVVIAADAVPEAAMKPIREAARGATMKRIEEVKISHETKEGKVVKLPKVVTHYAVELKKGDQEAEIVVDAGGKVIEPAKFGDAK